MDCAGVRMGVNVFVHIGAFYATRHCRTIPHQKQKITNDVQCQFYIVKCSSEMRTCVEFDICSREKWKTNTVHSHALFTLYLSRLGMYNVKLRLNRHRKTVFGSVTNFLSNEIYVQCDIYSFKWVALLRIVEVLYFAIAPASFHIGCSIINLKFSLNEPHIFKY